MRPASPSTGALLPTTSIQTYVHVHGPHSLVPVAGWHRRPSPPASHLAAGATAAWRLIRVSFQAICCVAAGSRRVRYIIRCTFGQVEVTQSSCCCYWSALHFQTLWCLLACIPAAVTCFCIPYVLHCCFLILQLPYIVSLAASTGRLNRCPRAQAKSAFPNASGRINLEN